MDEHGEIIIYQAEDGLAKIDVRVADETVWLTQAQLCNLYQTSKSNVSEHIKHIFEEGELEKKSSCSEFPNNCRGREKLQCFGEDELMREAIVAIFATVQAEGSCDEASTCRNFRQVRMEGSRQVERELSYYELISIQRRNTQAQGGA